jgi:hypothetical protein
MCRLWVGFPLFRHCAFLLFIYFSLLHHQSTNHTFTSLFALTNLPPKASIPPAKPPSPSSPKRCVSNSNPSTSKSSPSSPAPCAPKANPTSKTTNSPRTRCTSRSKTRLRSVRVETMGGRERTRRCMRRVLFGIF